MNEIETTRKLKTSTIALTFREADKETDFKFARKLHHDVYRDVVTRQFGSWDEPIQDEFFKEGWNRAPHMIILFEGIQVGIFSICINFDHIFFNELQILPEYQGKGIGSKIFQNQMDLAQSRGVPLRLQVLRENRAQELYSRFGFVIAKTTDTHVIMEWNA